MLLDKQDKTPSPKVLIASLPGCGTTYTSAILGKLMPRGRVTHEGIYSYDKIKRNPGNIDIEVSGFCVDNLSEQPDDVFVIHQVRKPMDHINTCHRTYRAVYNGKHKKHIHKDRHFFHNSQYTNLDWPDMLAASYLSTNRRISQSPNVKFRFRVEDEIGADLVDIICRHAGYTFSLEEICEAIDSTPKNVNSNRDKITKFPEISIDDISKPLRQGIENITDEYGY